MAHHNISASMIMADLIHLNPQLLPVINRFGIRLGFGDRSIHDVCGLFGVNPGFFLEIINAYHDEKYFPQNRLQQYDARMIIDYLHATHIYYEDVKVPELQELINRLLEITGPEHKKQVELLNGFFSEYVADLKEHLRMEEQRTFPYVIGLQDCIENIAAGNEAVITESAYTMYEFVEEHSNLEDKLLDLKNIIIKYIQAPLNSNLCNKILEGLFQLENDIRDHARIEDKVLVPKVKLMEKKLAEYRKGSKTVKPAEN